MGFRGFSDFNTSLFGKQFWRLLTNTNSLVSKVFKSRYYPRSSILEAKTGYSPSFAWRSILSAGDVVKRGYRWRLGNGESIRVGKDNWVEGSHSLCIQNPVQNINLNDKVSTFIDHDLHCWKRELILNCFESEDAKAILSIPISGRQVSDKIIWPHEKDGEYSVKSAYRILSKVKSSQRPGPSSDLHNAVWKKLWQAPIQIRVKEFLWRASKDIIPTKTNLRKKGMYVDSCCPLCLSENEDITHLLIHCQYARQVWFASILGCRIPAGSMVIDWIEKCLQEKDVFGTQLCCYLMWKIWDARNKLEFKQVRKLPQEVAADALNDLLEFNGANALQAKFQKLQTYSQVPSVQNAVATIHIDAGCFENNVVAFGCVIRNPNNDIILSACNREFGSREPALAELLAIRWGLRLAKNIMQENILACSDALYIVDCINNVQVSGLYDNIVVDCRELVESFHSASVPANLKDTI